MLSAILSRILVDNDQRTLSSGQPWTKAGTKGSETSIGFHFYR